MSGYSMRFLIDPRHTWRETEIIHWVFQCGVENSRYSERATWYDVWYRYVSVLWRAYETADVTAADIGIS